MVPGVLLFHTTVFPSSQASWRVSEASSVEQPSHIKVKDLKCAYSKGSDSKMLFCASALGAGDTTPALHQELLEC